MEADVKYFSRLSRGDLRVIASHGVARLYARNSIIVQEGDDSDTFYVILHGRVKVFASDENGKDIILNIQGPWEYFGELSLIDGAPRSASVMAIEPTRLACLSRSSFERCLAENSEMAVKLIGTLVQRIRALTAVIKELALQDVHGRVVHVLLKLASERDGKLVIDQRLTHQDIADMVGASREMVSRIMKDLTTAGLIEANRKSITIEEKLVSA